MNCLLYADGTRINSSQIIGSGLDGFIVYIGNNMVLKTPKLYGIYRDGAIEYIEDQCHDPDDLEQEKKIYTRLSDTTGVAKCIGTSLNGITLEYYPNGSLEHYIENSREPELVQKQKWISEIVDVVARCHEKHVLIFDIALRNFVLAEDWSVRIVDFGNSVLFPDDINMSEVNDEGCTVKLDMLHLANVICSIFEWRKFAVDCAMESDWPNITQMPRIEDSIYSYIVANCWRKQYSNVHELQLDVEHATKNLTTTTPNQSLV